MDITYSAATSQDGFIAREDGDVAWLDELNIDPNETGLAEFFAGIDGLVMGRATYDFVFNYGTWPYAGKPAWICTSRELMKLDDADLRVVSSIQQVMNEAELSGLKHLWLVGGGRLASAFLNQGFLSHLSIAEMPIKLRTGIPLFAEHRLEEIQGENAAVVQKNGFRQIDIVL